jgi:Lon protease-like protein
MAKIIDYETLPNGRMNIVVQGMDRFKIIQPESQIKPYLQGFIQLFSDHVNEPIDAVLVHQVKTHYQEIIRLNHALENQDFDGHIDLPDDPTALSFYIGDLIQGDAPFKQTLLESQSLSFRLNQELKYLESAIQRLAIYNQIEDIFRNSKAR